MPDTIPIHRPSSIFEQIKEMQDRVMQRAYEIFEQNGGMLGRDLDNWNEAERELVWRPAFELCEKDGKFQLEAAISGIDAKDIDIQVTPEDIILRSEVQHHHTGDKGTVHYCEFQNGRMFRAIHLPKKINPDKVRAEFKNGLLRVNAEIAQESRARTVKPEAA